MPTPVRFSLFDFGSVSPAFGGRYALASVAAPSDYVFVNDDCRTPFQKLQPCTPFMAGAGPLIKQFAAMPFQNGGLASFQIVMIKPPDYEQCTNGQGLQSSREACGAAGASCGRVSDGCGGWVSCDWPIYEFGARTSSGLGGCEDGWTCGGRGGVANVCNPPPVTPPRETALPFDTNRPKYGGLCIGQGTPGPIQIDNISTSEIRVAVQKDSAGYGDTSYFTLAPQSHGAVWKRNNCEEPDVLVYTHGDFRTMFKLKFTYESNNCDYVPGYSSGLGTSAGSGAPIFAPVLQTIAALPPNRQQINVVNDTKYVFTVWVSKSMRSSCDGWRPGEPQPACPATGPDAPGYVYDQSGNDVSAPLGPGEKRSFDRTRWRNGAVYVRVSYMETHLLAPAYEALPPVAAGQTPTIPQWSGDGWYTTAISLEPDDVSQGWLHLKYDSDTSPDTPDITKFRHEYNNSAP